MLQQWTSADWKSRVVGCVVGGAVGDALGAPLEGLWSRNIPEPAALLSGYSEFEGFPRGQYTDDTQLTLATLRSIVRRRRVDPGDIARSIARLWRSQEVVGPGGACTAAADRFLAGVHWSRCGAPIGQAGNGTAMRTAALGLCFRSRPDDLPEQVAQVSRITHQDPRSVAGGVAIASAALRLASAPAITGEELCDAVARDMRPFDEPFASLVSGLPRFRDRDSAETLDCIAWGGSDSPEFPEVIITPFVVPTVLAALWAVTTNPDSWESAVASAIGLGGDVDTLGAIVGGLMGARLGRATIPEHLATGVLDSAAIHELALRYFDFVESGATAAAP